MDSSKGSRPGYNDLTGQERPDYTPPIPQNNNSATNVSREADGKLLDIVSGQLLTVARESSKMFSIIMLLIIFVSASTAWTTWRISKLEDIMVESNKINEQAKKQIWEFKTALNLKFSQERGKRGESKTEMP